MTEIYRRAALCRAFEDEVFRRVKSGEIKCPVYLSSGQETIAATLSYYLDKHKPAIFPQHRNHAQYLCFGGDMTHLIRELTGGDTGMQGSASIADGDIFGHDGLMGSNVPIGVGYCEASQRPTIIFFGDAAAEEDYVLAALGYAATKRLPVLFVCEDNNLAILTQKSVRRAWGLVDVAKGFGLKAFDFTDTPEVLSWPMPQVFKGPMLFNVVTSRYYWHAGAGQDGTPFDRHAEIRKTIKDADAIDAQAAAQVKRAWECYGTPSAA